MVCKRVCVNDFIAIINLLVAVTASEAAEAKERAKPVDARAIAEDVNPGEKIISDADRVDEVWGKQKDDVGNMWNSPTKGAVVRTLLSIYVDDETGIKQTIVDLGAKAEIMGAWDVYTGDIVYPIASDLYTFQRDKYETDDKGNSTLIKSAKSNADLDQIVLLYGQAEREYS